MNVMASMASRKEKGFTLIELVMVIVILGILAAFALPRFADFSGDAREASIKGAAGAVRSAAAIAHSRWLADSKSSPVTLEGNTSVAMSANGYPTEGDEITKAAQLSSEFIVADDTISLDADADGAPDGDCSFTYSDEDGSVTLGDLDDC